MYFFRKLFGLIFFGLLIFGLFGMFGRGRHHQYQEAYRQGYVDGQQAAVGSEESADGTQSAPKAVPDGVPGTHVFYRGHGFFFPGFGMFLCLIPLFLFGLFFSGMGKRRWHKGHRGHWNHKHGGRGPCGPRGWHSGRERQEQEPTEKSPEDIDDGPGPDEPIYRA